MSRPVRFPPPDAKTVTTACNYCVVGCGYRAYLWEPGTGSQVPAEEVPHMSPSWAAKVHKDGKEQVAAIVPDPRCPINRGNHSIRGGTLGRTLTEAYETAAEAPPATRERLTTPLIRLGDDAWAPLNWDETLPLLADLIHTATAGFVESHRVGAKLYGYHSLENTFAAMTLFRQVIGTPNVADHDRPSTAGSSPGLSDAGIHHHAFSYEDLLDCDVVFLLGSNAYECQSVMFQQAIAGRKLVVLDPRRTITADYAVRTGGIHLQPSVLGADCKIVHALARLVLARYGAAEKEALAKLVPQKQADNAEFGGRRQARIRSFEAWQKLLHDDEFAPATVAKDTGIPLEQLEQAADLLARGDLRSTILYEKGLIWGYNYQNTAAVANLGILTFNFNAPNREGQDPASWVDEALGGLKRKRGFCGRLGGHQKGFAKPKKEHKDTEFTDQFVSPAEDLHFFISNYQDVHLAGRVAYEPPPNGPQIEFKHEEDITFFWVTGCNPAGDMPDAQRKWQRIRERLEVGREQDLPTKERAVDNLRARVQAEEGGVRGLVIVQQDIYPNYTSEFADLILPASGFGEDAYTRYNGERRLRLYDRFQDAPLYDDGNGVVEARCKPDWQIFTEVAQELAKHDLDQDRRDAVPGWKNSEEIFETLAGEGMSNRSKWLAGLRKLWENEDKGYYDILRQYGTTGVQLPSKALDCKPWMQETPTLHHTKDKELFFVDSRWNDVKDHYTSIQPDTDAGEVWITNGRVNEAWNSMYSNLRNEYTNKRYPDNLPGTVLEVNPEWARAAGFENGDVVKVEQGDRSFIGVVSHQESVPPGGAFALFSYPCNEPDEGPLGRWFFGHGYANNVADGFVDPNGPISANKYGKATLSSTSQPPFELPTTAQRHRAFSHDVHRGDDTRWMARELLVSRGLPRISILLRNPEGKVVLPGTTHGVFWHTTHATWEQFLNEPLMGQFPLVHRRADGSFDAERSILLQMLEGRGPLPQMPLRSAPLPPRLVRHLRRWIENGCPEADFAEILAILDHGIRIHARHFGPDSIPAENLILDPDHGIDQLHHRARPFLELIDPTQSRVSPMCWRDDNGDKLSSWTAREFEILERFIDRPEESTEPSTTYDDVCRILSAAVEGEPVMALHGAFWTRLRREQFIEHKVIFAGGEIPVVRLGDGANSALVLALRGTGPFTGFRMPLQRPKVSDSNIARIEKWIDDGCP